jgi:hypothetical protein
MNLSALRSLPLWIPLLIVLLLATTLWGILTILGADALQAVPSEIRPLVFTFASLGNAMTALTVLAFWPLITAAFLCMGVLIMADPPEFRVLACGIGLAHLPALMGTLIVFGILLASDISVPTDVTNIEATRQYLLSQTPLRIGRLVIIISYMISYGSFTLVVRDLFKTTLIRAIVIVSCPLILYYLGVYLLQR